MCPAATNGDTNTPHEASGTAVPFGLVAEVVVVVSGVVFIAQASAADLLAVPRFAFGHHIGVIGPMYCTIA